MSASLEAVRRLHALGVPLYCWSSGGAAYARASAEELGLQDCFLAYLPKPKALFDDVLFQKWEVVELHPNQCLGKTDQELLQLFLP